MDHVPGLDLPAAHRALLQRAVDHFRDDKRVMGLVLGGSLAHGVADLHIAAARMARTRRSPKNCRLGPFSNLLSGEHEGENVGCLATIERRKCSRKRRCAMADRSDRTTTKSTRREPQP